MKPTEIICPHCQKPIDLKTDLKRAAWRELHASIVRDEVSKARDTILAEVLEHQRLKEAEKEALIAGLRTSIELLQRKATQASQQIQGEVMEIDVIDALRREFPLDNVTRIGKGRNGADILHSIRDTQGGECGSILIEVKNTSTWSDGWLAKLRADALRSKAALAVLVSRTLPKEVESFGHIEGIWVTTHTFLQPLTLALRAQLVACAVLRNETPISERDAIVSFITSRHFAQRVQAIVTVIVEMRGQVDREKQAMTKYWVAREKMLSELTDNVTGFCAELETVTTRSLLPNSPLQTEYTAQVDALTQA